jgi:hypothetical protein
VSRRVSLPGADELFRRTSQSEAAATEPATEAVPEPARPVSARRPLAAAPAPVDTAEDEGADAEPSTAPLPSTPAPPEPARSPRRTASGRVRHDEKMTVYVTADELLEIEHARLVLRRTVGSAVDRGRLVRAAVAMALADLDEHGDDSELVRRLSDS